MPPWLVDRVDALPPLLGRRPLCPGHCVSACRFSGRVLAGGVGRVFCHLRVALLLFMLSLCFLAFVCFFSISFCLVFCALVVVNLRMAASRLFL